MSAPLTSFERAERLFKQAEKLGCYTPTESMIAEAIQDAEFDTLWNPKVIAERHGGQRESPAISGTKFERDSQQDKERLDWLSKEIGPGHVGALVRIANLIHDHRANTFREAIDAAMGQSLGLTEDNHESVEADLKRIEAELEAGAHLTNAKNS